jgi:hypothetical protein
MLTKGGLSKDEPAAVVMQWCRELTHATNSALLAFHHGKKEQFDQSGQKIPSAYYGAIWIKAHTRIMWRAEKSGPDGSARTLHKEKDNLGVCLDEINLHYDHHTCLCTMVEDGDSSAKGRLHAFLQSLPVGADCTTDYIATKLKLAKRTLRALFNDTAILSLVVLVRQPGKPTVWRRV